MILHEPFIIGSRLFPALKVGEGTLTLVSASMDTETASVLGISLQFGFYLDTPEFEYFDDNLQPGCGGCTLVGAFETFLNFLEAAIESYDYELRYPGREGENTSLFPRHVVEWAYDNRWAVEEARSTICDEDGYALTHLIEE